MIQGEHPGSLRRFQMHRPRTPGEGTHDGVTAVRLSSASVRDVALRCDRMAGRTDDLDDLKTTYVLVHQAKSGFGPGPSWTFPGARVR